MREYRVIFEKYMSREKNRFQIFTQSTIWAVKGWRKKISRLERWNGWDRSERKKETREKEKRCVFLAWKIAFSTLLTPSLFNNFFFVLSCFLPRCIRVYLVLLSIFFFFRIFTFSLLRRKSLCAELKVLSIRRNYWRCTWEYTVKIVPIQSTNLYTRYRYILPKGSG